jgi:uncharacterized protein involved in exopolysaccharide biosynthesis
MSTRTVHVVIALVLLSVVPGCGYKFVKKSALVPHTLPADSVRIATLETQLATLRKQHIIDSTRYADLLKEPPPPPPVVAAANTDTLLRAREQEIQTLRDQLAKMTAEMDRIKRRLATPRS